ncbi:hypothetical protein [Algoriphagus namhaensis]
MINEIKNRELIIYYVYNTGEQDLIDRNSKNISLLHKFKNSLFNLIERKNLEKETSLPYYAIANILFKTVDKNLFFEKKVLYFNQISVQGKYNNYIHRNDLFLYDLDFLIEFRNLEAISLCGQSKIVNHGVLGNLKNKLKEINLLFTTVDFDKYLKDLGIDVSNTKTHNLSTLPFYLHNNQFHLAKEKDEIYKKEIESYLKIYDQKPYPRFIYPITYLKRIDFSKHLNSRQPSKYTQFKNKTTSSLLLYNKIQEIRPRLVSLEMALKYDNIEEYEVPYLSIIDHLNQIFISIEISEYYDKETFEPINYIGYLNKKDLKFIYNNWYVIKFTESQIQKNINDCTKYILKVYSHLISHTLGIDSSDIPEFESPENPWEKEVSIEFAEKGKTLLF